MALDYDLYLSTKMKSAQAMEKLADRFSELNWSEDRFHLFDVTVSVCAIESASSQEVIQEAFHFTPTLIIGFRRLYDADWDTFRSILLDACLLLLDEAQDAVLLFNGERIELQRIGGQLAFNVESGYWRDEDWLKSRLTIPFEVRPLTPPYSP
jgi:hypothetical protein